MRPINYALPVPHEMGMVGLRSDVLFVAPASSFHHNNHHQHDPFISDHTHNHHHNHNHHSINNNSGNNSSATALGIGVIPLLTTSTCGSSQLWQNQQTLNINYQKKPILIHHENSANPINMSNNGAGVNVGFGIGGTTTATTTISSSTKTCQDCGNQAKKDCSHSRCRTCCKSRGYDCNTHVKSTWVSAARRRDRQLISGTNTGTDQGDGGGGASSGSTSGVKKPRLITTQTQTTTASHTSTSNTTPPRSFDTSSSHHHQDASFREALPRQVQAPASFKCVRVTPIGDGEDEFAYQAIVKIGGHVFKGFLYNKGVVNRNEGMPNISELHLGGSSSGGGGGKTWASSSSPIIDPSDVYAATGSGLFGSGGTIFGNAIN